MAPDVSSFTYSITRPYPYPRFKWIVVIGGVLATALFTVINIAATGYVLRVAYTSDWNETMNQRAWFQRQPISLFTKTQTSCQSLDLQIESQFFTDKRNFIYTLVHVWQKDESEDQMVPLASLSYTNNAIENCVVDAIDLQLESTGRTAEQVGWTYWGVLATASIRCSVNNSQVPVGKSGPLGPTWFNLTAQYELLGSAGSLDTQLGSSAKLSETTNPITWWGRSLMEWHWLATVYAMNLKNDVYFINDSSVCLFDKGFIKISPQISSKGILGPDFFGDSLGFKFLCQQIDRLGMQMGAASVPQNAPHTIENLISIDEAPNIWHEVDNFGRSFYSIILADLGQQSNQNILLDSAALGYFTHNFSSMTDVETPWLKAGPARYMYNGTESFTVNPSYIYTNYLCQIPQLKSNGALFIAILVADLVFLQAAWKLLNWVATLMVERKDPQAHFARGCLICGAADIPMSLAQGNQLNDASTEQLRAPNTAASGNSRPWRSSSQTLTKYYLSSDSQIPMLVDAEHGTRSTWHDRTSSSEAITTGVDSGTHGQYQRL